MYQTERYVVVQPVHKGVIISECILNFFPTPREFNKMLSTLFVVF